MKKYKQTPIKDKFSKKEPRITSQNLIAELKPLLNNYFIGDVSLGYDGIVYTMPNGQTFLIKVRRMPQLYPCNYKKADR